MTEPAGSPQGEGQGDRDLPNGRTSAGITFLFGALAAVLLAGCLPSVQNRGDEEKEPHFMAGKSRVNTLDTEGAIECFEKALQVNPRSAAAHFELACIFDQNQRAADPAAAIYHYTAYLKLRSNAGNTDVVNQRIQTCKQELARNVSMGPLNDRTQREIERLVDDNKKLTEQQKRLTEELDKWRAYGARVQLTNSTPAPPSSARQTAPVPLASSTIVASVSTSPQTPAATKSNSSGTANLSPTTRTHTVAAGETATSIARKYGVKLDALQTANPHMDSRRLKVGQSLVIPGA